LSRGTPDVAQEGDLLLVGPVGVADHRVVAGRHQHAGDPRQTAGLAAIDAQVSHARDGIHCAQVGAAAPAADEFYERISLFHYPGPTWHRRRQQLAMGVLTAARGEYVPAVLCGANIGCDAESAVQSGWTG
jgi:hypothetical protein